jgi:A/G-specific adenine glycosylase
MLHQAAKRVVAEHKGKVPSSYDELITLPGIGDYTAKAILVFAYNRSEVMIETNIRAAYLHAFFPKGKRVPDKKLLPYITQSADRIRPREWYWALMDYGSHIKSLYPNPSQRSAHHVKQKPFKGSEREVRGAIIRELSKEKTPVSDFASLGFKKSRVQDAIKRLMNEGLIEVRPEEGYVLSS